MMPFKHLPGASKITLTVGDLNYLASMLIECVEKAEGIVDGGPITREAEKHWAAWAKLILSKQQNKPEEV